MAEGTLELLKDKTKADSLEEAFLNLTGYDIRDENIGNTEKMRLQRKIWKK